MCRVRHTAGLLVCRIIRPMGGRGRRIAERQPRSRAPLALAAVALAAILVTVAAAALWPDRAATPDRTASGTPSRSTPTTSARLDLADLPIRRTLDCSVVDDEKVRLAIAWQVTGREAYRNGDRVEVAPGLTDVAHEDGCIFSGGEAEARVWVFAAPVGTSTARGLVRDAGRQRGCSSPDITTRFGSPSLVDVCRERSGTSRQRVVATLRGLFDDAWLSCQVSGPADASPDDVVSRAEQWCVHVATTLGARP